MSAPSSSAPAPLEYRGETKARRTWIAIVLSLLMPGLGHLYAGAPRRAAAILCCHLATVVGFVAVALILDELFFRILVLLGVFTIYVEAEVIADVRRLVRRLEEPYVLASYNTPLAYVGAWLLGYLAPLVALGYACLHLVVGLAVAQDAGMYPQLRPGEVVLYDRMDGADWVPPRGSLVVAMIEETPTVLRVVGMPGDTISIQDKVVAINGVALEYTPLGALVLPRKVTDVLEDDPLVGKKEHAGTGAYEILLDTRVLESSMAPVDLGPNEFFLLADFRDGEGVVDSRTVGPIDGSAIVGLPRFVVIPSRLPQHGLLWSRIGVQLH